MGDDVYDLIVVGSGNGACGFLAKYLDLPRAASQRILVLEEGQDFFGASDLAHENNWVRSFSQSNIFKLRNATTRDGTPVITARAVCQGGGGSINYTMIHEENKWLAKHIGRDENYWKELKMQLNAKFDRIISTSTHPRHAAATTVLQHLLEVTKRHGYTENGDFTGNFPNFNNNNNRRTHRFPTPFNRFGQRTASGVSIVDWSSANLELRTRSRVTDILFEGGNDGELVCVGVQVDDLEGGNTTTMAKLKRNGRLVLAAGSTTPELLLPHREALKNGEIGGGVSDHILLPLGLYILPDDWDVTGKDIYLPLFATAQWKGSNSNSSSEGEGRDYGFDFHAGQLRKLIFMLAHLFLAFLLPNGVKKVLVRRDLLFRILTNLIRVLLEALIFVADILRGVYNKVILGRAWKHPLKLITATLKYQPQIDGNYEYNNNNNKNGAIPSSIRLGWFHAPSDAQLAKDALAENIDMINALGTQPPWVVRKLLWYLVRMPYRKEDIPDYVDTYKEKFLLSQLHLSGGCNVGKALHEADGKVKGSRNVYVADLSAVTLPRVSCQMTAYLMGFHIANAFAQQQLQEVEKVEKVQHVKIIPRTVVSEAQVENNNNSAPMSPETAPEIADTQQPPGNNDAKPMLDDGTTTSHTVETPAEGQQTHHTTSKPVDNNLDRNDGTHTIDTELMEKDEK